MNIMWQRQRSNGKYVKMLLKIIKENTTTDINRDA